MKATALLASSFLAIILLSGCSDAVLRHRAVQDAFTNAVIVAVPDRYDHFVVRDNDGAIWWVECEGMRRKITGAAIIIPAPKTNSAVLNVIVEDSGSQIPL